MKQEVMYDLFKRYKQKGIEQVNLLSMEHSLMYPESITECFRIFDDMQDVIPVAVIVGQDPYPQKGVATGIAFANHKREGVWADKPLSPSLKVIKESVLQLGQGQMFDETLMFWVKQGIMPINMAWTVVPERPGELTYAWARFTSKFLSELSSIKHDICYVLLGGYAQALKGFIKSGVILSDYHPSYYARTEIPMSPRVWERMISEVKSMTGKELRLSYEE